MRWSSSLGYAETHYKFKLPWSPLSKPWPELIIDAPFQLRLGQELKLWIIAKDAHLFPAHLEVYRIHAHHPELGSKTLELGLEWNLQEAMGEIPLPLGMWEAGPWQFWVEGSLRRGTQVQKFWNHNLPGLEAWALRVQVLEEELPRPKGWLCGDVHVHSSATSDQVEFGASALVNQDMARQIGLDFVLLTDHSYDLSYDSVDYLRKVSGSSKFHDFRSRALSLNEETKPLMIWGEEVSCANHLGQNVHLLVAGYPDLIPGEGDGGRRWLNNKADLRIGEVLELAQGYPCMAAHPRVYVGALEKWIFNRGMWHAQDLDPRLCGLQFASGNWNRSAQSGQEFWQEALTQGLSLGAFGGSDAHGDFNANYAMHLPLLKLKASRAHLFGQMKTWLKSEKSEAELLRAMQEGPVVASNGPWLHLERVQNHLVIQAQSSMDLGLLGQVVLESYMHGQWQKRTWNLAEYSWELQLPLDGSEIYVARVQTTLNTQAVTSLLVK